MNKVEIANMALEGIGSAIIENFTDGSEEANTVNRYYDYSRRAVLRAYPWAFATKQVSLARIDEEPLDYTYTYKLPSDCLNVINLIPETRLYSKIGNEYPFSIRGTSLYCDIEEVNISYIYDCVETDIFDSMFINAFTYLLASNISVALSGDKNDKQLNYQMYSDLITKASAKSANESKTIKNYNPYVTARG